jgi:GLPGLI family protein
MKTNFFIASVIALLLSCISFAQNPFEGSITYSITFDGLPAQAQAMMGNTDMKVFTKKGNTRTELNMLMMENITIYDAKTKTANVLMNLMGKKYCIKQKAEELEKDKEKQKSTITYSDETKKIASYTCKKAIITFSGSEVTTTVWYTEEIPNALNGDESMQDFKNLKGMPMEFEVQQPEQGFTMKMLATKVLKENVDDAKFIVPEGYTETTKEELMKSLMGTMEQK